MASDVKAWEGYGVIWLRIHSSPDWINSLYQYGWMSGKQVALVELGPEHNQLGRFVAAVHQAVHRLAGNREDTLSLLEAAQDHDAWIALINQVSELNSPLILVLAGYDQIENQEVHQAVTELLDYQPESIQIVLFCQSSPPLPLPRLRARRVLLELTN